MVLAFVVHSGHRQVCGHAFCHGGLGVSRAHDVAHNQCRSFDWRVGILALRKVVFWMVGIDSPFANGPWQAGVHPWEEKAGSMEKPLRIEWHLDDFWPHFGSHSDGVGGQVLSR